MVDLGTLGGTFTAVMAVSDGGQVVGSSVAAGTNEIHAFSWTLVAPDAPSGVVAAAGDGSAAASWLASR